MSEQQKPVEEAAKAVSVEVEVLPKLELGTSLFESGRSLRTSHKFGGAYKVKVTANGEAIVPLSKNDSEALAKQYPGLQGRELNIAQDKDKRSMAVVAVNMLKAALDRGDELVFQRLGLSKNKKDGRIKLALTLEESPFMAKESLATVARALGQTTEQLIATVEALKAKEAEALKQIPATVAPVAPVKSAEELAKEAKAIEEAALKAAEEKAAADKLAAEAKSAEEKKSKKK